MTLVEALGVYDTDLDRFWYNRFMMALYKRIPESYFNRFPHYLGQVRAATAEDGKELIQQKLASRREEEAKMREQRSGRRKTEKKATGRRNKAESAREKKMRELQKKKEEEAREIDRAERVVKAK